MQGVDGRGSIFTDCILRSQNVPLRMHVLWWLRLTTYIDSRVGGERLNVACAVGCMYSTQLGLFVRIRNNLIRIKDNFGIIQIIIRIIRLIGTFS
jgi:hypothetical protein